MSETSLTLRLTAALHARLEALAARTGESVEETAATALAECVERWEDHFRACDALEAGTEPRALLQVPSE